MRGCLRPSAFPLFCALLLAVSTAAAQSPSVQATGTGSISVKPNQAQLNIGVVTDGATAQEAAQKNASQTTAVLAAVNQVLGTAGTVQTTSYSVYPRYNNQPTQTPVIVGYTASNTLQATIGDLSLVGKVIDSANQAGANNVGGLTFGLQDPEPVKQQALTQAAKQARAHADAIAAGLGVKTGAVISAQEGATYSPINVAGAAASTVPTPVQTGQVTVTANVTVTVQLVQ
jgi:uncharacterized protein YggE